MFATLVLSAILGAPCNGQDRPQVRGDGTRGATVAGPLGARADSVVRSFEARGFSGVVRIAQGDSTLLEKGYGLANRALGVPFSPQTLVQIGSNTKDFTAVAILQLQERGLLSIRDSIGTFFPEAPADKQGITVLQVMEHRAGFPDFVAPPGTKDVDFEPVGRDEFLRRLMQHPLVNPPGTRVQYSNAGYSLLAALIERISRTSYDVYLRDHILNRLGLKHTGFALPKFDERQLAHGYRNGTDIGTILAHPHPPDGPYWNLRGNGGMSSTVGDMHAFYTALFSSDLLLKPETRDQFFHVNEPIALAGSDGVSVFVYERFPRLRTEIIIASNNSEAKPASIRRALAQVLGLPSDDGPNDSPGATAAPSAGSEVPKPVGQLLTEFVRTLNTGDAARIRAFIVEHFAPDPDAPPLDARVRRLVETHGSLGELTVLNIRQGGPGAFAVTTKTGQGGRVTIRAEIDPGTPPRIRRMGIAVNE